MSSHPSTEKVVWLAVTCAGISDIIGVSSQFRAADKKLSTFIAAGPLKLRFLKLSNVEVSVAYLSPVVRVRHFLSHNQLQ